MGKSASQYRTKEVNKIKARMTKNGIQSYTKTRDKYFRVEEEAFKERMKKLEPLLIDAHIMEKVLAAYTNRTGKTPTRLVWNEKCFPNKCTDKAGLPCLKWECNKCQATVAQVIMVIVSSKNAGDNALIPFYENLFNLEHIKDWSMKDWLLVEEDDMIRLIPFMNTLTVPTIRLIFEQFCEEKRFPTKIEHMARFPEVKLKLSALVVTNVTGFPTNRIATDLHVARIAPPLGWVKIARTTDPEGVCQELATYAVVNNMDHWMWRLNDVCGGMGQVLDGLIQSKDADKSNNPLKEAFQSVSGTYYNNDPRPLEIYDLLYDTYKAALKDKKPNQQTQLAKEDQVRAGSKRKRTKVERWGY